MGDQTEIEDPVSWLIMVRDACISNRAKSQKRMAVCMVTEMESGDLLWVEVAVSPDEALTKSLKGAAQNPPDPSLHRLPDQIVFGSENASLIRRRLAKLGPQLGLDRAKLIDGHFNFEDHELFDSLIGHMSGRRQPDVLPDPYESQTLYDVADLYVQAEPWRRWADTDALRLDITIHGARSTYTALILGQDGIQRGLVLYPGREVPDGLHNVRGGLKLKVPNGSLLFHLDPPAGVPAQDYVIRALRYGWPPDAEFMPSFLTLKDDHIADLSSDQVLTLSVGVRAALAIDAAGRRGSAGQPSVKGRVQLPDEDIALYEIRPAPAGQSDPSTAPNRVRAPTAPLVPPDVPVVIGSMPWESLEGIRRKAHVHRLGPLGAPPPSGQEVPFLAITPTRPREGEKIAAQLERDNPHSISLIEFEEEVLAVLACAEAAHVLMEVPANAPELELYRRRLAASRGHHLVMVVEDGAGSKRTVFALFECFQPPAPSVRAAPPQRPTPGPRPAPGRRPRGLWPRRSG